jgi:hypothetical protein
VDPEPAHRCRCCEDYAGKISHNVPGSSRAADESCRVSANSVSSGHRTSAAPAAGLVACLGTLPLVPILVQGPAMATETRSPMPLVIASRTAAASRERIPHGAASLEGWFGGIHRLTRPAARRVRLPATERASDSFGDLGLIYSQRRDHSLIDGDVLFQKSISHHR